MNQNASGVFTFTAPPVPGAMQRSSSMVRTSGQQEVLVTQNCPVPMAPLQTQACPSMVPGPMQRSSSMVRTMGQQEWLLAQNTPMPSKPTSTLVPPGGLSNSMKAGAASSVTLPPDFLASTVRAFQTASLSASQRAMPPTVPEGVFTQDRTQAPPSAPTMEIQGQRCQVVHTVYHEPHAPHTPRSRTAAQQQRQQQPATPGTTAMNDLDKLNDDLHKHALWMDRQQQLQAGTVERPISYGHSVLIPTGNAPEQAQSVIVPTGYPSPQLSAVQPAQKRAVQPVSRRARSPVNQRSSQPMVWAETMRARDAYERIRSL